MNKENADICRTIFENNPIGYGVFKIEDPEDLRSIRYVEMNTVILKEMNKTGEEIIGKRIYDVDPLAYSNQTGLQVIETYFDVAKNKKDINLGRVKYESNGNQNIYECSVHSIDDNMVYVRLTNITDLYEKELELAANRKIKTITTLLSGLSHEINNPLNYIAGSLQLIKSKLKLERQSIGVIKYIRYAEQGVVKVNRLIKHLNAIERNTSEKIESFDIVAHIERVLDQLAKSSTQVQFKKNLEAKDIFIKGNKKELTLAFKNIIQNAIDAVSQKNDLKVVTLNTYLKENHILLEIKDNGAGIPEEHLGSIFDTFFTTKDTKTNMGIGLTLAQVYLHGSRGNILVNSTLGSGSNFTVKIPLI